MYDCVYLLVEKSFVSSEKVCKHNVMYFVDLVSSDFRFEEQLCQLKLVPAHIVATIYNICLFVTEL